MSSLRQMPRAGPDVDGALGDVAAVARSLGVSTAAEPSTDRPGGVAFAAGASVQVDLRVCCPAYQLERCILNTSHTCLTVASPASV